MTYRREWSRSCLRILRIGLALGLLGAAPAAAQLLYGGLVGAVIDSQGAVVPGARVVIVNTDTNFTREAITDAQGAYSFTNIQAGPYVVKVSLQGFREAVQAAVPVRVGQISRVDLTLQVGAMSETITVQSAAELLQTDKADVHTELKSKRSRICRSIASGTIRGSSSWCRARCRRPSRMPKPTRRSGRST